MNNTLNEDETYFLTNILNNLKNLKNCVNEYDNLIVDKLNSLDNYKLMLSIIRVNEVINKYFWNLTLLKSGENINTKIKDSV